MGQILESNYISSFSNGDVKFAQTSLSSPQDNIRRNSIEMFSHHHHGLNVSEAHGGQETSPGLSPIPR